MPGDDVRARRLRPHPARATPLQAYCHRAPILIRGLRSHPHVQSPKPILARHLHPAISGVTHWDRQGGGVPSRAIPRTAFIRPQTSCAPSWASSV